jgi:hypothetical protein
MAHEESQDQLWIRRFWIFLGVLVTLSATIVVYSMRSNETEREDNVYILVQARTLGGDDQNVLCKVILLVDPEQENGLQSRKEMLETIVNETLTELYRDEPRPGMSEVRDALHLAINRKLPRNLQVREVLIQELLVGIS